MNLAERIAACLNIEDKQKTKRNKKLFQVKVDPELRNIFIHNWFKDSLTILDKDQLQKDLINLLNIRGHEKEIDAIETSIFSLGISCAFIEKRGLEDVNQHWFRAAFFDWIESERLGLTIGNLHFYQMLVNERKQSEIIPGSLIKNLYWKYLPANSPLYKKKGALYSFLDRQCILLKVAQTTTEEKFIFCSYPLRKAIKHPSYKAGLHSSLLAQKYLVFKK